MIQFDQVWSSLIKFDQKNNNIAMYRTAIACARSQKGDYKLVNIFAKSYTVQNKTVVGSDIIVFAIHFRF